MTKKQKTSSKKSTKSSATSFTQRVLSKVRGFSTNTWMLILAASVLGSIGLYFAYRQYAIVQDRKQFERAEVVVDQLYAGIVQALGEPITNTKDKSCSYASAKFARGTRGCGISVKSTYNISEKNKPIDLGRKIATQIRDEDLVVLFSSIEGKNYESLDPSYSGSIELASDGTSKKCYISLTENINTSSTVTIFAGCSGRAQAEYYPVRD